LIIKEFVAGVIQRS